QSLAKEKDGLRLGADHFHATSDESTFTTLRGSFDLILNTVSASLPLDAYLGLLRLDGALVNVGVPSEPSSLNLLSLIVGRRTLTGSNIGGIRETQEMLDFCGEHQLGAEVEVIGADEVGAAYDRVVRSDVRFRFVIDVATLDQA
ncbi:zinc-binding dehydrogenase, partial [Candidatus Frankia nodulisporulans]|uniref:zinc-binding dehydrogenase n=2 Tax=Candidatus Frankia nodulisporulans TaxID=2060052 RepID=UPI0037040F6F